VNDVLCGVLVYAYVFAVLFIVEKLWKGDQAVGRKILHMSMGNIVFLLWLLTPVDRVRHRRLVRCILSFVTHRMQRYSGIC
jgi:dolichol kinase